MACTHAPSPRVAAPAAAAASSPSLYPSIRAAATGPHSASTESGCKESYRGEKEARLYCFAAKLLPLKSAVRYSSVTFSKLESWRKGCKYSFTDCAEAWEEGGGVPASFQAPQHHFQIPPKSLSPAQLDATQSLTSRHFQNGRFAERKSSSSAPARSPGAPAGLCKAKHVLGVKGEPQEAGRNLFC